MTSCPVCGKPVDPLRAPAVGVREGKVVSYCSREHALEAESRPVIMPIGAPPVVPTRAASEPGFRIPEADQKKNRERQRTPASGVPAAGVSADSGPVIEITHEPVSGVVTSAPDARDKKAGENRTSAHSQTSGAIQIADTGHLDDYISEDRPRGRKAQLVFGLVVVAAVGGIAAYGLAKSKHTHPVVAQPDAAVHAVVTPDAAPAITNAEAITRARGVLTAALASDSPRVQRVAASALARTGDAPAIAALVAALAKETSDLAKLDILYALARGGDKRGTDGLVAALAAPRRDVKAEAARRLALLGDKHAIDTLAQYLEISQFHLGAAEQLAFLAEPRAIKALDAIRADTKATPDDKARAAIALGYAGKADIAPALHDLLADARFNAFAAASLASLHDAAARPILIKQLEVSSLRVSAARSLRRLDPGLDATPLLPPLIAALASAKDTEQVMAAEEVLLLAGPVAWSAHE